MKYCANCGKEMDDYADVCIGCGCSAKGINTNNRQTVFCTHCGKEIPANAAVCVNCGCAVFASPIAQNGMSSDELTVTLSKRVKIDGIIWLCIAVLQIIAGISYNWVFLIPGVLNIFTAVRELNISKKVLTDQTGIIKEFEPLAGPIIAAVYNLIIGGIIGVAGSIYYFVAIRQFVMNNRQAFEALEAQSRPVFDKNTL